MTSPVAAKFDCLPLHINGKTNNFTVYLEIIGEKMHLTQIETFHQLHHRGNKTTNSGSIIEA